MTNSGRVRTPHPLDLALGRQIREWRKSLGISQAALAEAAGMTFQQIQKYERAFTRVSFSRLVSIARALGCSVADLTVGLDDADPDSPIRRYTAEYLRIRGASELLAAYVKLPVATQAAVLNLLVEAVRTHKAGEPIGAAPLSKLNGSREPVSSLAL